MFFEYGIRVKRWLASCLIFLKKEKAELCAVPFRSNGCPWVILTPLPPTCTLQTCKGLRKKDAPDCMGQLTLHPGEGFATRGWPGRSTGDAGQPTSPGRADGTEEIRLSSVRWHRHRNRLQLTIPPPPPPQDRLGGQLYTRAPTVSSPDCVA